MEPGDRWTGAIRRTLEGLPSRAIRLSALLGALEEGGLAMDGRESWLERWLESQHELCRVIPDRAGPWARCPGPHSPRADSPGTALPARDPFILVRPPTHDGPGRENRTIRRIRESVTAWGEEVDDGSPPSLARWIRAMGEAERACRVIGARRSAEG